MIFILLVSIGVFCQRQHLDKVVLRDFYRSSQGPVPKHSSPMGIYAESRSNYREDNCCVKRKIVQNGKIKSQCSSEDPDCFTKSSPKSPNFGKYESVRDSENDVIACRCAAKK